MKLAYLINILIGTGSGLLMLYNFDFFTPPTVWDRVAFPLYWFGIWPLLILIVEQFYVRVRSSILLGLSLTLPMYLSFACPWLMGNGSFLWPFAILPMTGVISGPLAGLAGRLRRQAEVYSPLCAHCGYSLWGLESSQCPECGTEWDRKIVEYS